MSAFVRLLVAVVLAASAALPAAAAGGSTKKERPSGSAPASPAVKAAPALPASAISGVQAAVPASAAPAAAAPNAAVAPPNFNGVLAADSADASEFRLVGDPPAASDDDLLEQAAKDRTRFDGGAPTVAVITSGSPDAAMVSKAGGKLAPGHVHMVVDKAWIERQGRQAFLKKSITYDADGNASVRVHDDPVAVKAFVRAKPAKAGEPEAAEARERAALALARASRRMLKGKRIVVVGAGYENKKPFLETAKRLGVKVILVDRAVVDGKPNWARGLVSEFIDADLVTDPEKGLPDAVAKLKRSIAKRGKIDGITTYWEDDVVETAKLAKAMGLRYHSVEAATIARSKHLTIEALSQKGAVTGRFTAKIRSEEDLEAVISSGQVPDKWFIKPDAGAEAMYTASEKDGDLRTVYRRLSALIAASEDTIFKGNRTLVLTRRLEGNELDDNFIMQNGRRLDFRPTDNWPTRPGSSKATGSTLPARMLTEAERRAAMERSVQELRALGFTDGVFHVERMGEDLLEINPRPGGSYTVDWNARALGIDEAEMLYLTAVGLPAFPVVPRRPKAHLEGAFVFTQLRGKIKRIGLTDEAKKRGLRILIEKKAGKVITDENDRVAMIFAAGKSHAESLKMLGDDPARWLDLEIE